MELITSGGRLKGDLDSSLKTFDRYKSIENFNNKEYDLMHIFTDAKKLYLKCSTADIESTELNISRMYSTRLP